MLLPFCCSTSSATLLPLLLLLTVHKALAAFCPFSFSDFGAVFAECFVSRRTK
jgi:hypothetical protein